MRGPEHYPLPMAQFFHILVSCDGGEERVGSGIEDLSRWEERCEREGTGGEWGEGEDQNSTSH